MGIKLNRMGTSRVEERPETLRTQLCWYLVDHQILGQTYREIAKERGVGLSTVMRGMRRVRSVLPTIRELIPK